ncbi:MAG TPA: hypothetical protein VIG66_08835 [Noviherbaspirillum sp.]
MQDACAFAAPLQGWLIKVNGRALTLPMAASLDAMEPEGALAPQNYVWTGNAAIRPMQAIEATAVLVEIGMPAEMFFCWNGDC